MKRLALVSAIALVFGVLGAAPVSAAPPVSPPAAPATVAPVVGAAGIGDAYFPHDGNGGYDVKHYGLRVRYNPVTNVLTGRATIEARALQPLSRFNLDLDGLRVDSVRVDGRKATWTRAGQELQVTPARALRKNRAFTVKVRYLGVPKVLEEEASGRGGVFPTADGALVVGQPHVAATWFPVNDHPSDKASYAVAITVPKGVEAISNGKLTRVERQPRTTTWHWQEKAPMASYLATAAVGQFKLKSYRAKGVSYLDAIDPVLFRHPEPRTGRRFAASGGDDNDYKRLSRTIEVPRAGGKLSFSVQRNTEQAYDYFAVEARPAGSDAWTTLPDLNGHTSSDPGFGCPRSFELHPFLQHYQTASDDGCTPTGTTGRWNAATGRSEGYERWSIDLGAYAGQQVQVALSVISDDSVSYPGAYVDDVTGPGGAGSTSFEADGNTLDGWTVPGPPAGSPAATADWRVTTTDPEPSVGQNAEAALANEPAAISYLSGVLGPYPFKQAGGIVDDDPDLGYALENQTRPIYSAAFFGSNEVNDSVVVHELAHQWTGDDLALERWQDIWLNEGFATYMEWLWGEKQGRPTPDEIFAIYAGTPADDPFWGLRIGDPGPEALFDGPVYDRGAMTLHALRATIGDDAFFTLLKQWTATYSGKNVSTPQFIALAEQVSSKQLDGLFQTWLYTPTKPAGIDPAAASRSARSTAAEARHAKSLPRR